MIMKKKFSKAWSRSVQPRKQRKYRYNAPLHTKHKFISAHLDKSLRKQYKRRSLPLRTGDEVTVMRGKYRKKTGKISRVDLKSMKVFMDSAKVKKPSGQEIEVGLEPSNIKITKINMDDKERKKYLLKKGER